MRCKHLPTNVPLYDKASGLLNFKATMATGCCRIFGMLKLFMQPFSRMLLKNSIQFLQPSCSHQPLPLTSIVFLFCLVRLICWDHLPRLFSRILFSWIGSWTTNDPQIINRPYIDFLRRDCFTGPKNMEVRTTSVHVTSGFPSGIIR